MRGMLALTARRGAWEGAHLMSQDVDVVPHVPGGGGPLLAILTILELHFTLHVGFLDHFHLQEGPRHRAPVSGRPTQDGQGQHTHGASPPGMDTAHQAQYTFPPGVDTA